jgi:uncharacterized protein YjiK
MIPRPRLFLALIAAGLLVSGATRAADATFKTLHLVATHPLTISEPSDLTLDETGKILWTVTNKPAKVYQLDLEGNVTRTLNYGGQDLEGIVYDPASRSLYVTEERLREIVHLNLDGDVLDRTTVDLPGKPNHGPEGITLDDRGRMFLVNEKQPGLFLELDKTHQISKRVPLSFAGDYSAITWDKKKGCFWIASDESQSLFLWSSTKGVLGQFPLGFAKAEGVAVDEVTRTVYVVSDLENKLYVYRF